MVYGNKIMFVSLMASAFTLSAEEVPVVQENPPHHLYIGPSVSWYNISYTNQEHQSGCMYGGILGYDYLKNDTVYGGAHLSYLTGDLTGSFGNSTTQEIWTEGRLGYTMSLGQTCSWAPYTGYGYFVFLQDFTDDSTFRYRFMYIPLGFKTTWQVVNYLEMGFNAMGGIPFASRWNAENVPTTSGSTRIIATVEIPFRFFLTPQSRRFELTVTPYWRNWSTRDHGSLIGQVNNIVGAEVLFAVNL